MTRDEILERLRKMKALASRGVGGERKNAERLMALIAAEYGIDLDQFDDEELKTFYITLPKKISRKLLCQLCALKRKELELYGALVSKEDDRLTMWGTSRMNRYAIKSCTDAEWVEMLAKLKILTRAFNKQVEEFYSAFLFANDLMVEADEDDEKELSLAERQRFHRIARMSMGIEKTNLMPMIGYS